MLTADQFQRVVPILTVFLSGIFGLVVASTTVWFTDKREKWRFRKDLQTKRHKEMEDFYVALVSTLEKAIRLTKDGGETGQLEELMSLNNARVYIVAPRTIHEKMDAVSDSMLAWSGEYMRGSPKQIGDSRLSVVSIASFEHLDKAKELYPSVVEAIKDLVKEIKVELRRLKSEAED